MSKLARFVATLIAANLAIIVGCRKMEIESGRELRAPAERPPSVGQHLFLEASPAVRLQGVPGETVKAEFLLTNYGPSARFQLHVRDDGVRFPDASGGRFVPSVDGRGTIFVRRDETRLVVVSVPVPLTARLGEEKVVTLQVSYEGRSRTNYLTTRRFIFRVDNRQPKDYDFAPPVCSVERDTWWQDCAEDASEQPMRCRHKRWTGRFAVTDYGSGLRSVQHHSTDTKQRIPGIIFSEEHFVIGTTHPEEVSFSATCCVDEVSIFAVDLANQNAACAAGRRAGRRHLSAGVIAAITVSVLLVVVATGSAIALFAIRKRRNAEVSEMIPQGG